MIFQKALIVLTWSFCNLLSLFFDGNSSSNSAVLSMKESISSSVAGVWHLNGTSLRDNLSVLLEVLI